MADKSRTPIAVKTLRFNPREPVSVPGKTNASSLTASSQANRGGCSIEYRPWMRHFVIVRRDISGACEVMVMHETIPEGWEPGDPEQIGVAVGKGKK